MYMLKALFGGRKFIRGAEVFRKSLSGAAFLLVGMGMTSAFAGTPTSSDSPYFVIENKTGDYTISENTENLDCNLPTLYSSGVLITNCNDFNLHVDKGIISTIYKDEADMTNGGFTLQIVGSENVSTDDGLILKQVHYKPNSGVTYKVGIGVVDISSGSLNLGKNTQIITDVEQVQGCVEPNYLGGVFGIYCCSENGRLDTETLAVNVGEATTITSTVKGKTAVGGIYFYNPSFTIKQSKLDLAKDVVISNTLDTGDGVTSDQFYSVQGIKVENVKNRSENLNLDAYIKENLIINNTSVNRTDQKAYIYGISIAKSTGKMDIADGLKINQKAEDIVKYKSYMYGIENEDYVINIADNAEIKNEGIKVREIYGIKQNGGSTSLNDAAVLENVAVNSFNVNNIFISQGAVNIGDNFTISNETENSDWVYNIRLHKPDSSVTLGDGGELINAAEKATMVCGISAESDNEIILGNDVKIRGKNKNTAWTMGVSIGTNANMTAGDGLVVTGEIADTDAAGGVFAINNYGKISLGKNAIIKTDSVNSAKVTVYGINNQGEITLGDGAGIATKNEEKSTIALRNKGETVFEGALQIDAEGYAVYNAAGNISMEAEGKDKIIRGDIQGQGDSSLKILMDTDASSITGGITAVEGGEIAIDASNKAQINATVLNKYEGAADGKVSIKLDKKAVWNVTGSSSVDHLELKGKALVDMTGTADAMELEVNEAGGTGGILKLKLSPEDINHAGTHTDFITIGSTADGKVQKYLVTTDAKSFKELAEYDFAGEFSDKSILFSDVAPEVELVGDSFNSLDNVYDYKIGLGKNIRSEDRSVEGNNWYVTSVGKKENIVVETAFDNSVFLYNARGLMEIDSLHKRIGGVRNSEEADGIWVRSFAGRLKADKKGAYFKDKYDYFQLGYDRLTETEHGRKLVGMAVDRGSDDVSFRNGSGDGRKHGFSLYESYAGDDNSFLDIVLRRSLMKTKYDIYGEGDVLHADYKTYSNAISAEIGKKYYAAGGKSYLTPIMQFDYSYVKGTDYTTSTGVNVHQSGIHSLVGRAGFYAGRDTDGGTHYLKASVLHEFKGDYDSYVAGADDVVEKNVDGKETWFEVGLGGRFLLNRAGNVTLYYDLEKSFHSDIEKQWQGTLGIEYEF